jgi:DUF438 domain-containing protein
MQLVKGDNKFSHLSKVKEQANLTQRALLNQQEDLIKRHKEIERKSAELFPMLEAFGTHILVTIMRLNKQVVLKPCGGQLRQDLSNLKDFLSVLKEVIL